MASARAFGKAVDAVVIGGGIIGCAAAYELAKCGLGVKLFEKKTPGHAQSGRNWGFVRQQGRSPYELPLMRAAISRWEKLDQELGKHVGWCQGGSLALADSVQGAERYRSWLSMSELYGREATRLVSPADVQELVPGLALPFRSALFTASDGQADPAAATAAYAAAAERMGAEIVADEEVVGIASANGRVTGVSTSRGKVQSRLVVCAAGANSRTLLKSAGVWMPQALVRSTVSQTPPLPMVTQATVWASGLSFRQASDGTVTVATGGGGDVLLSLQALLLASWFLPAFAHNRKRLRISMNSIRPPEMDEPAPNSVLIRRGIERLKRALPHLEGIEAKDKWAGCVDSTPDGLPVLDAPGSPEGLIVGSGFSGHGFGLAPVAGEIIADLANSKVSRFNLYPFRLSRFRERDYAAPDAIL